MLCDEFIGTCRGCLHRKCVGTIDDNTEKSVYEIGWKFIWNDTPFNVVVVQWLSCVWLCNSMNWSTSGFLVLPYPPDIHVHWLSQWCHPTISSSVTHFSSCPQSLPLSGSFFQWVSSLCQVAQVLEFQHQHMLGNKFSSQVKSILSNLSWSNFLQVLVGTVCGFWCHELCCAWLTITVSSVVILKEKWV